MSEIKVDRWLGTSGTARGCAIQSVRTTSSALQTMTTTVPHDDTIPTSSEGTEVTALATTITPQRVGNVLKISIVVSAACSTSVNVACCLFKDSGAAAVAVTSIGPVTGGSATFVLTYYETVVSLTAITFKVRMGPASAATVSVNGLAGVRLFGGVSTSTMTVEEIQA